MPRKTKSLSFLRECRDRLNKVEGGFNKQKYEALADAYNYAQYIAEDEDAFQELAEDEFFADRRKTLKQEDALRLAMVFLLEADAGPLYERACNYTRALQPFFRDKIEAEEIPDLIEDAGGIERLYRDVIEREKRESRGLQIEATNAELDEVLETEAGCETTITIKRLEDGKGGWVRFGISSIDTNV